MAHPHWSHVWHDHCGGGGGGSRSCGGGSSGSSSGGGSVDKKVNV